MQSVLFLIFISLSSFAYGFSFDDGVYAPKLNPHKYKCSWFASYDSSTNKLKLSPVNDIWNGFKCNEDESISLDCVETEAALTCKGGTTVAVARVPFTLIVQDFSDVSRDLGILIWRAEVAPAATKYHGKVEKGWTFQPGVRAHCLLEPGSVLCEALAEFQVRRNCEGLGEKAKARAIQRCLDDNHQKCEVISSNVELTFMARTKSEKVFTGCVAEAVASASNHKIVITAYNL